MLPIPPFVVIQPGQIQRGLSKIRSLESTQFQLNEHQPFERAMVERQVAVEVLAIDDDAFLPLDKGKPAPNSSRKRSIFRRIAASKSFSE